MEEKSAYYILPDQKFSITKRNTAQKLSIFFCSCDIPDLPEKKKSLAAQPVENPATFLKIKAMLEEKEIKFKLTKHKPVFTS